MELKFFFVFYIILCIISFIYFSISLEEYETLNLIFSIPYIPIVYVYEKMDIFLSLTKQFSIKIIENLIILIEVLDNLMVSTIQFLIYYIYSGTIVVPILPSIAFKMFWAFSPFTIIIYAYRLFIKI